jgi:hypothetical protein
MKKLILSALALTLSLGTAIGTAAPAQAADPDGPSTRWLGKQLTDGVVHNEAFDFDDFGLTIDVGIALDEMGGADADVKAIRKAIAKNVESYTTFGSDVYAGPTAKAAAFAQLVGKDPSKFGGVDLIKQLRRLVATDAPIAGRIQDKGMADYANVIGQAFAVQALSVDRNKRAKVATKFLLKQQCKGGYFRLGFTADKTAGDQTCDGGKRNTTSAPDTDATAIAVLSLLEVPKPTNAVREAVDSAVRWLSKKQRDNGSFGGGTSTEAPNANSTGLASWALGSAGACGKAHEGAEWLTRLLVSGVPGEKGAIAYDKAALAGAKADGIGVDERDQFIRATAQAAPALVYTIVDGCD